MTSGEFEVKKTVGLGAHPMPNEFYPWREKPRYSDCLAYVTSGHAVYHFGTYSFEAGKGDLIYMAYLGRYLIESSPDYAVAYADFMLARGEGEEPEESGVLPVADQGGVEKYAIELIRLSKRWLPNNPAMHMQLKSIIYGMMSCVALYGEATYVSTSNREKVAAAEAVILQKYSRSDFSCRELSDAAGMSEVHFRRLFSGVFGVTPSQYLTAVRMREAKALLSSGNCSITEIAERIGYSSVYYFSRAFRRECGVTPSEFRKMGC